MFKQPFVIVKTRECNCEDRSWLNLCKFHLCSWALKLAGIKFCDDSVLCNQVLPVKVIFFCASEVTNCSITLQTLKV